MNYVSHFQNCVTTIVLQPTTFTSNNYIVNFKNSSIEKNYYNSIDNDIFVKCSIGFFNNKTISSNLNISPEEQHYLTKDSCRKKLFYAITNEGK